MWFRRTKKNRGLMALARETAQMGKTMMIISNEEAVLEKEIQREEHKKPTTKLGRFRNKTAHLLHSKHVLLAIVIINVLDCVLVMGELILDIKYSTDLLTIEKSRSREFVRGMQDLYPGDLSNLYEDDIEALQEKLLKNARITWIRNNSHLDGTNKSSSATNITCISLNNSTNDSPTNCCSERAVADTVNSEEHVTHHVEKNLVEEIAHALHKTSITLLAILVVETIMKVFCFGKELLQYRLECFDGFIIVSSFIVDIVFVNGLQKYSDEKLVLILSFLVPWRIIRVVNSLVVAIMDQLHFKLKLFYKQKKTIAAELKNAKEEIKTLEMCMNALQKMCEGYGLPCYEIKSKLELYRNLKTKKNALGALTAFAMEGHLMNEPFQNGHHTGNPQVAIMIQPPSPASTEEPQSNKMADNIQEFKIATIPELDSQKKCIKFKRSQSAIEHRHAHNSHDALIRQLAANSTSFIVTINRTGDINDMSKHSTSHQRTDSIDINSYNTKDDKDQLLKDVKEDKVTGMDNVVTYL